MRSLWLANLTHLPNCSNCNSPAIKRQRLASAILLLSLRPCKPCACTACRYNAQAHVNRGVVLLEAGSLEEALQAFSDAAAIQPLNVQALYNLG